MRSIVRSYIKIIQIIQKHILWTFGGVLIIIKCNLKIDLIMSDFDNVSSFFKNLLHSAAVWLFYIWQITGNSFKYFSTSSMYSVSVSVKIFSELTELHHTSPLDPHCLIEPHHPSIHSPPTYCSHPLMSAHAFLHCFCLLMTSSSHVIKDYPMLQKFNVRYLIAFVAK